MKNNYALSNVALGIGFLIVLGVLNPSNKNLPHPLVGVSIVLGTLIYRSAKKRKLGLVKDISRRTYYEGLTLAIIALMFLWASGLDPIGSAMKDPTQFFIIPAWILFAYIFINSRKEKIPEIKTRENGQHIKQDGGDKA